MTVTYGATIFVLLCIVQHYYVGADRRLFRNEHNYPQKQVYFHRYSFKEGILVYAVCENSVEGKSCIIVQENYHDGKSQKSCNVSLQYDRKNANLTRNTYVAPFGLDKSILFWGEISSTSYFKLLTVQMDTCEIGGFSLRDPASEIYDQLYFGNKIAMYNETFEMFIKKNNLLPGADGIMSVMTVDSSGSIEQNPIDFMKIGNSSIRFISPIENESPRKSYVYTKSVDDRYVLAIDQPDGSEKVLASFDKNAESHISMINNLITLCLNSTMRCTQFGKEGDVKFNFTFEDINLKGDVRVIDLYNLPDGGVLILLAEYFDLNVDNTVTDYNVIKINNDGKNVGSIRNFKELVDAHNTATKSVSTYVWKNGNEEYCAAEIVQGIVRVKHEDLPSDLNVVVNCFTEDDWVV